MSDTVIERARKVREQICWQVSRLAPFASDDETADLVATLMLGEKAIDDLTVELLKARTTVQVVDCDRPHVEPRRESALWIVQWVRDLYASLPRPGVQSQPGRHRPGVVKAIEAAREVPALPAAPERPSWASAPTEVRPVVDSVLANLKPPAVPANANDWDRTETFSVPGDLANDMEVAR